jgi:hypothetical protein
MEQIIASISGAILSEVSTMAPLGKIFRIWHSGPELEPQARQPRKCMRSWRSLSTVVMMCFR